jgi:GNAT superfamily N-acetyltransferase
VSFVVERASDADRDLLSLYLEAIEHVTHQRGGPGLLRDIAGAIGDADPSLQLDRLVAGRAAYICREGSDIVGFAATDMAGDTILAVYVVPERRRRGAATALVTSVIESSPSAGDAWVLPGDRATKSLYEKAGWKARRLTMSAE